MSSIAGSRHLTSSVYKPGLEVGAKVEIISEPGTYLVAHIDHKRHVVDLLHLQNGSPQLGIHISAIRVLPNRPVTSYVSRDQNLINEILGSDSK